jgi:hypothetical protein
VVGPAYHNRREHSGCWNRKPICKGGQASPDDGDALALTFAQVVAPPEKEEDRDEDDEFGGINGPGAWMR